MLFSANFLTVYAGLVVLALVLITARDLSKE